MPENAKTPEIRFAGFTDAWEQRRLDSVFDPIPNNTLSRADLNYKSGKIKNVHYGDILIKYGAVTDCRAEEIPFITGGEVADYKSQLLRDGDVLFADTAEDETVGKATEIAGIGDGFIVSGLHTMACRPNVNMASGYLGYYLNSSSFHHQLLSLMQGIKVLSVSRTNLYKTTLTYPASEQEQSQIGATFASLDRLVALHRREHDKTVNIKKAMLEKMFPKDGADKPEIRFAGFTDAWEERAVFELADRYDNLRTPITASDRVPGSTPYYGANGIQDYVEGFTHDGEFILIAEDGANDLKNYPVQYINGKVWVNNHAHVLQSKQGIADNRFLMYAVQQTNIEPFLVGGGRAKLNADVMMKIRFHVPALKEQVQIGQLIIAMSDLISLHRRELEKLQNMKSALLEKMFV